ncbi:MAG TPA: LysM peptidoglycan-binding domain-containing protein [Chloroflexi bacterium]|jgi:LysM repeat protein|nr:LysM peptidoglycan-binding domain-containing protein [Chloroflexota bacterium]
MVRRRLMTVMLAVMLLVSVPFGVLAEEPREHIVTQGQTLSSIARMYGVTVQALVDANGLTNANVIYVGQRLVIPEPEAGPGLTVHIVQAGESLLSIAARYGVTVRDLATHNGISNWNLIFVGQRLVIPGDGVAPSPGATAPDVQEAIIIANPSATANVSSPMIVNGWGRAVQNTLAVDVIDSAGVTIGQGFVIVDAEPGFMGPFTGTIEFTPPASAQAGRVQVYSISARDGAIEHLSSVEVNLQP